MGQLIPDHLAQLAADLANANAEAKKAAQRADEIKTQIRDLLATHGPGQYDAHGLTVNATQARTIDPVRVAARYPATEHPYLYAMKPDVKKVRAMLDEAQLEDLLTDAGELRIAVTES